MASLKGNSRNLSASHSTNQTPFKVGAAPYTGSTRATSSAFDLTPATVNTASFSIAKGEENPSKNTQDILAQWRLEREQGRDKLGDIMNRENGRMNEGKLGRGSKVIINTDNSTKKVATHNGPMKLANKIPNYDKAALAEDAIDDDFLDAIFHDHLSSKDDYHESTDFDSLNESEVKPKDGSSIKTTPTTNTALNSMGIDRLCNRNVGSIGVTSLNVRLFQPIDEDSESHCSQEDVSLITQDTELQNILRPFDADRMMEEIEREQNSRLNAQSQKETNRQSTSTLHSKGVQEAFSSLQVSLEKSRAVRNEQEQQLAQQKETIERLSLENAALLDDSDKQHKELTETVTLLVDEVNTVRVLCSPEGEDAPVSVKEVRVRSIADVLSVVKVLAEKAVPSLLDTVKNYKQSVVGAKAELEQTSEKLNHVKADISKQEEEWSDKQKGLSAQFKAKQNDLAHVHSEWKQSKTQLDITLSLLQANRDEVKKSDVELTDLNLELGEKHLELSEVNRLCEERIRSAHTVECNAKAHADATIKKHESLKAKEKTWRAKRGELDNDRLAWETQLQLKSDEIDSESRNLLEQQEEIVAMTASMESKRLEFEAEYDRVKAVQNDLLQKESFMSEKESLFSEKQNSIIKQTEQLEKLQATVTTAQLRVDEERSRLKEKRRKSEEELESRDRDLRKQQESRDRDLRKQQNELDEEREQYFQRLKAVEAGEGQLKIDCKELSVRVDKFKLTVKAAKAESERKKAQHEKLETAFREKEAILVDGLKELAAKRLTFDYSMDREKVELERMQSKCAAKEQELVSIQKKCNEGAKSLKKLNAEVSKVRDAVKKKMQDAKVELQSLGDSYDIKQTEFKELCKKVRLMCMHSLGFGCPVFLSPSNASKQSGTTNSR